MKAVQSPIQNAVGSVFVHVTDLRRAAEWYSMVLGLPLLEERLNGGPIYWLELEGGTGIILDDNRSNGADTSHVLFSYKTADIDESYRYLEESNVQLLYPVEHPHPDLAYFNFADPEGNAIMVTQSDYASSVIQRLDAAESPIMNRIGSVFINITNMNQAIQFHSSVLGLPYSETGPDESIYDLPMENGCGVLLDDNRFRHGEDYKTLFMFITQDVDASKTYLEANDVEVFTDIERYGNLAFFTVKDPDHNIIMICSES